MTTSKDPNNTSSNKLLSALPAEQFESFVRDSELKELDFGTLIYKPNDIIDHVYFPNSGIISLLSTVDLRSLLEIGIVGREGMIGLPVFLGVKHSANQAIVQGEGSFLKMPTEVFLNKCDECAALPVVLRRYTHSLMMQVSQSAVCNRFHQVDARLARWLLMTQDRMNANEFQMTQNFLSNMLGVRREAVTIAAGDLQQRKLIEYSRGSINILDRNGLEAVTCICYGVINNA